MSKRTHGSNRTVIQLSDENYLSVITALTPPGETGPQFGMLSKFFNQLVDDWRARRALATTPANQEIKP